ncbi:ribonuclease H-like domain-containing protein [Anaeromicropila populeti]|uniref:YprB ribonuclease H-like domain-containing protein n=1 Tax=Anaeromicropila populeti TaxID=37658 RepID=A0A1I6KIC0_9FIRM|nr:ribonuclease H-like domain-containing protein [Anaeromicropila populeti]SFR90798.1 hypothetical protein SAMN05661086_02431 [Anaeromicropila populeti]
MITIQKTLQISNPYPFHRQYSVSCEDCLFFDIETTGFQADISNVYLIGCCFFQNNHWQLIQWFADDYISEKNILEEFVKKAKSLSVLLHYNGTGFDLPYLKKKFIQHDIDYDFSNLVSIDLYKKICPYKWLLPFSSLKQKSIEEFLSVPRKDLYSGGDLISAYVSFIKEHFMKLPEENEHLHLLLLHNEEDVSNLILLTQVLSYSHLFETIPHTTYRLVNNILYLTGSTNYPLPHPLFVQMDAVTFTAHDTSFQLEISLIQGELKYFFSNYKEYYYLPEEDTAIHKSVAEFVDKAHRIKAKASNCYTRKAGLFAPQYNGTLEPKFKYAYKDKQSFIEMNSSLMEKEYVRNQYAFSILTYLCQCKTRNIQRK